jgi:tetratricopeptide (TPR) repeat protein
VLDVLDAAELVALVVETPDSPGAYRFAHALVQQTLYQQTSAARRRHAHLRAAEALSDLARTTSAGPAGAPSSLNARLAVHYELAGHPIDAIAAYRRAAVDALSLFALDESVRSLRRALDLTQELPRTPSRDELELEVRIELGVPLVARDGYGSASSEAGYKRAFELSNQLGRPVEAPVLRGLGLAALMGCRFDDSSHFAVALLDQGAGDPVATTEGHYLLGVSAFWLGDLKLADEQLSAAIATYRADLAHEHISRYAQDPKAISLVRLALTSLWLGEPDRAAALADDALNFADALGHPTSSGYVLAYAALTAAEVGDLARLERLIDAGDTLWTEQRLPMFANTGRSLRGWLDALAGRGVGALEAAVDCWRDERQSLHLVHSLALLARFFCRERDIEAGRAATREALDRIEVANQRYLEPELLRIDGELLALDGDNVNAVATLERALETARAHQARWLELRAACSLARLAPGPAALAQLGAALDAIGGGRECADVQEAQSLLTRHR